MILTQLKKYADERMSLPPAMYGKNTVRWLIELAPDGRCQGWTPQFGSGRNANKRGLEMVTPHVNRTAGVKPKLLADTGEYVLGIPRSNSKPERVAECHAQFKQLVNLCLEKTGNPAVAAVAKFLENWNPKRDRNSLPKDFDPGNVVTFQVNLEVSVIPAQDKAQQHDIEKFWAEYTSGGSDDADLPVGTCLVTGETKPLEKRLPFLIKGIPGGQPSGTALVSANSKAFESYGLENTLTSPISRDAAEKFAKALNQLIVDPNSRLYLGKTALFVWWTREPTDFNFMNLLAQPGDDIASQQIAQLYQSPYTTQEKAALAPEVNRFYALTLSANTSRTVVRSWLDVTLPQVQANLRSWFDNQCIFDAYGQEGKLLGIRQLANCAFRDPDKEMLPSVPVALLETALQGKPLPVDLLAKVVRRNRVDRSSNNAPVTHARAALLKLILTTQSRLPANNPMSSPSQIHLTPEFKDPKDGEAYHCGCLLAQLEAIQQAALGKINATLTDRYYGAASSTPATAFPPLLRGARSHLSKLRKNKRGAYTALDRGLEAILAQFKSPPQFPKTLTMPRQGIFALGFYHQRAHNRAARDTQASKQRNS